jgi:hypothetical protein
MLNALRLEANDAADRRGHAIAWGEPHVTGRRSIQNGVCSVCGEWVQINDTPLPNDIEIGGPAVAINCVGENDLLSEYGCLDEEAEGAIQ